MTDPTTERPPRQIKDLGPLHQLLLRAAPTAKEAGLKASKHQDRRSIQTLAKSLKMSTWGVYLWIRAGRIPPEWAKRIVDDNAKRDKANPRTGDHKPVTLEDFHPFVYG